MRASLLICEMPFVRSSTLFSFLAICKGGLGCSIVGRQIFRNSWPAPGRHEVVLHPVVLEPQLWPLLFLCWVKTFCRDVVSEVYTPQQVPHFLSFILIPASSRRCKNLSSISRCFSSVFPVTRISSKYTQTLKIPCKIPSMVLWKIAGAADTPNGRLLYLNRPLWVLMTTNFFDSSSSSSCW